jgi:plasmid stabilization system protein ParE
MARRVVWAHSAVSDLEAVAEYIYQDSPAYAASFVNRALEAGRSLKAGKATLLGDGMRGAFFYIGATAGGASGQLAASSAQQ